MRLALIACCVLLAGCLNPESLGKDLNDGGDGASGSDATGDGDGDSTSGGETGDGTADGTDSTDATDTTDGETDGGMDGACAPADDDTTCMSCQKDACCDFWEACYQSDHCICIVTCMGEGHGIDACREHCGPDDGQQHDLGGCTSNHCTDMNCP
jgi:predicted small secreted protein